MNSRTASNLFSTRSRQKDSRVAVNSGFLDSQPGSIDGMPGIEPGELGGGIDEGIGCGRARSHFLSRVP